MKREEKSALSRRRILDAAMREFSQKGYDAASVNTICAENDISKGILYHYFKDKDALYLACAAECFERLTAYLAAAGQTAGSAEERLRAYFDARVRFFAEHPLCLGLFLNVTLAAPEPLQEALAAAKEPFDRLNLQTLTELLESAPLRAGLTVPAVAEDFRMYMDFFNARFGAETALAASAQQALAEHEARCHRQLDILLHGVWEA